MPFVALGYRFSDRWGIEGISSVLHTDFKTPNAKQINGNLFAINGIYYFPSSRLMEPYILAGPGVTRLDPNGSEAYSKGNVNVGVGAQIFIDKLIAFRLEARDIYTLTGGKNDVLLSAGVSFFLNWC
jgi:OOP family OmpA-OmpF porin